MRRTTAALVAAIVIVAGVIIFFLYVIAASRGFATLIPPVSLGLTLLIVGGVVIAFAIPIRRSVSGRSKARIDPFRAVRVAALAKSCSLAGSAGFGAAIGMLVFLLTRTVVPGGAAVEKTVFLTIAAALLAVAGLVSEHLCTIPPGSRDGDHHGGGHPQRTT